MLQNGVRPIIHPGGNGGVKTAPFPNWECAAASLLPGGKIPVLDKVGLNSPDLPGWGRGQSTH